MARRPRVVLNSRDNEKILKEAAMALLRQEGERIRQATGRPEDYEVQEYVGRNRARVTVRTVDNWDARAREARDHNLIRGLGGLGA